MVVEYTDSQKRIIEQVDEFCDSHVTEEQVRQWVSFGGVPLSFNDDLRQTKLWDYILPPVLGGVDDRHVERATIIERFMYRAGATLPLLSDMMSFAFLSTMRDKSQKEILEELTTRNRLAFSIAFTESSSGSTSGTVGTTVSWSGTAAHLDGEKTFVSGGQFMPEVLVLANDPIFGAKDGGLSLWLVPVDAPGVQTFPIDAVGQQMLCPAVVSFEGVKLDLDWQIQTEGKLDSMLKRMYELGRLFVSASRLGLAEAALDDAGNYAGPRMGKGRLLSSLPDIQQKIVEMEARVREMQMFVYDAASVMGDGDETHLNVALMKHEVPAKAVQVASDAMQIFGARGYTSAVRAGRIWRDCRGNQVAQGTDEVMTHIASKFIVKKYRDR